MGEGGREGERAGVGQGKATVGAKDVWSDGEVPRVCMRGKQRGVPPKQPAGAESFEPVQKHGDDGRAAEVQMMARDPSARMAIVIDV